ncbi:MAG TPA: hypothetical protein VFR15_11905 [Chloroflexia bacterium]|nr:hypothetical protein [Chloroflexia bacterium]
MEAIDATATAQRAAQLANARDWVDRLELNGSSPEAEAALKQWQNALRGLKSISGNQVFMLIEPDGTRHAPPAANDPYWNRQSTVERYDGVDMAAEEGRWRYYVALHTPTGDMITSYDGTHAYRTWSWMKEDVFRPLPDEYAQNGYWIDDTGDLAFANYLVPTSGIYSYAGRHEIDGQPVVELVVESGSYGNGGMTGTRVFLDEQTSLPYRFITYPDVEDRDKIPASERTFTHLQINPTLSDADFRPPLGPNTWFVYEPVNAGWTGYKLPVYGSVAEAEKEAGTPLFAPGGTVDGDIPAWGFVEKDNERKAVISLEDGTVLGGVHLPRVTDPGARFSLRAGTLLGQYDITKVDVNGIPAELWTESGGMTVRLRMIREGTEIEIRAASKEEALKVATSLQRVK